MILFSEISKIGEITQVQHYHWINVNTSTYATNTTAYVQYLLGITINCKYKWNDHITELITSLSKKLNIIKCLSNPKYQCDTLTLITIMKAIIISKIDFGIFLYGRAPKSLLNKLNTIINSSLRACFGAYRTSPTKNLMMEANIAPLQERYLFLKDKLFKSLHNSSDTPLSKFLTSAALKKRRRTTNSVLDFLIERCIELEIPIRPIKRKKETPYWLFNSNSVDLTLRQYTKDNTSYFIASKLPIY